MYGQGLAVKEDQMEALKWLRVAAKSRHKQAIALSNTLAFSEQYSIEQIREADKWATAWKPSKE